MFVVRIRWSAWVAALLVALTAACTPDDAVRASQPDPASEIPTESAPHPPGAGDSWMGEVSARIRDADHAFVPDGDGYVAEVPSRGLGGRFDAEGAQLTLHDDTVGVRVVGFGRDTVEVSAPVAPVLGACVADRVEPSGDCVRRIEYGGPVLTEWWATREEGFEQGWTVEVAPEGAGPLTLELAVEGAEVTVGDGELWLQGDAGGVVMVSGLAAWDADGVALAARFERTEEGFRVRVEDEGARYPVEIDPVYTTAAWSADGSSTSTYFGYSVSGAGDVNGDGYDDVIVGAYGYGSNTGRAYVYLGSASGLSSSASTTLTGASSTRFGYSVSGAGDVNGDGYDDVIVGAFVYSSYTGRAYIHLGSATGVSSSASTTLTGAATGYYFGVSVSGAGDINGDGYDDVIVGAPYYSSYTGRAYVYLGSASGVSTSASTTLTGAASSNYFGWSVSGAGDVNADSYDDVIVGAYGYSSYTGRAYVHLGSASGVSTSASTTLTGEATNTYFGGAVSGAGDVNGDSYDDVIVGARFYSSNAGRAYVYLGSLSGVSTSASTTLTGEEVQNNYFGGSVSGAGDINGDGYDDVIIGAYYYGLGTGRAYVYLCSASGLPSSASTTLTGEAIEYELGKSVSGAGDINGDGYDDVIVGADRYSTYTGRAYVHLGYAEADADADGITEVEDCDDADATVGAAAARYVDADGDGYGSSTTATVCPDAVGYADVAGDCDDTSSGISPAATELCDASDTDEDCDGLADDDDASATGASTFYVDADVDGYGSATTVAWCDLSSGYVANTTDCNDASATINPGATETVDDGVDQDCDSVDSCYTDADGDSYGTAVVTDGSSLSCSTGTGAANDDDCNDASAAINPAAIEIVVDGIDQDCDTVDSCYTDADGDNYGTTVITDGSTLSCATGTGAAVSTDCDDASATINPGASETTADGVDQDCDSVDSCYTDADGDSYGTAVVIDGSSLSCTTGTGATVSTDCNDTSAAISPAATEIVVDGIDQDCDSVDSCYTDADGDNYGTTVVTDGSSLSCSTGSGAAVSTDCGDSAASVYPGATETTADGIDQDCDGVDSCYTDADGDNYGTTVVTDGSTLSCSTGTGAANDDDCNDASATASPAGAEIVADGIDQDCDSVDSCYTDADGDTYGTSAVSDGSSLSCATGTGATNTTDCNDGSASINPAVTEIAGDEVDQNCDSAESCYVDADDDGARTAFLVASPDVACSAPGEALASADLDCDDTDASAYPAAAEIPGTGTDEDCDGDELCYADADGDGYRPDATSTVTSADDDCADAGEALSTALTGDCDDSSTAYNPAVAETDCTDPNDYNCDGTSGYSDGDADGYAACDECDDGDAAVHPGGAEVPGDGVDGDCDGVDTCYVDADDDSYRTGATALGTTVACDGAGEAAVDAGEDCDDTDAAISPAAVETVGDEVDANCDDDESCWADADGDGYRADDGAVVASADTDCGDSGEAATSAALDCDDTDDAVSPAATEIAGDEIDGDCDTTEVCYADDDEDGYRPDTGDTVVSTDRTCDGAGEAPSTAPTGDCDDTDAAVSPAGTEVAGDEIDGDCDGAELCYADLDDDGYRGDDGATVDSSDTDCVDATEALLTTLTGDCDDLDATYNPGATESDCSDPSDYNCDGSAGYDDLDADGYAACEECDDADGSVNPDATELPGDAVDQDCDGAELCHVDADDDGYRADASTITSSNLACDGIGEALASDDDGDCDDTDPARHPGATELPGDEVDQDCDGGELCYVDADDDGYVAEGGAIVVSADLYCTDTGEADASVPTGDCDDTSAAYNPAAAETDCADPADYDCDGSSGNVDGDADGFGACEECDDGAAAVNPDAPELCNDIDDDCDGTIDVDATDAGTWYADADRDGYTDPDESVLACDPPTGYAAATDPDCDDADAPSHPGGDDIPGDGFDQDCDGADASGGEVDDTGIEDKDAGACGCGAVPMGAGWALVVGLLAVAGVRRRAARGPDGFGSLRPVPGSRPREAGASGRA